MYPTTLSENAQAALALLGKSNILPKGTYLAGGSALALHFGHRISVDFDFFTPNSFKADEVAKKLGRVGTFTLQEKHDDTLLGTFDQVKFSLFTYEYPLVAKTISFGDIALASQLDIAAMKLAAIMDRGTKKDYVDLYFLTKHGIPFELAFTEYDKKYGLLANNLYSLITSMSYFDDAEKTDMPEMLIKTSWDDVKFFMQEETKKMAERYL